MTLSDLYFKAKEPEKETLQWISWRVQLFFSNVVQNLSNVVDYFAHSIISLPSRSFHYNVFKAADIATEKTVKQGTYMPCLSLSSTTSLSITFLSTPPLLNFF